MRRTCRQLMLVPVLVAIASGQSQPAPPDSSPVKAPNAWMKVPTDISTPDTVAPSIRSQRDTFWDAISGTDRVLTPENAGEYGQSQGSYLADWPEFPDRH